MEADKLAETIDESLRDKTFRSIAIQKEDVIDAFGAGWQWSDAFNDWLEKHGWRAEPRRLVVIFSLKGST